MSLQVFTSGDVLTAAKLNNVSNQCIQVSSISSPPGTPVEGMFFYPNDRAYLLKGYDGSDFRTWPKGMLDTNNGGGGTGPGNLSSEVAINNTEITATMYSGENYLYLCDMSIQSSQDANYQAVFVNLAGGSSPTTTHHSGDGNHQRTANCVLADKPTDISIQQVLHVGSNGTYTVNCSIQRAIGAGLGLVNADASVVLLHLGQRVA